VFCILRLCLLRFHRFPPVFGTLTMAITSFRFSWTRVHDPNGAQHNYGCEPVCFLGDEVIPWYRGLPYFNEYTLSDCGGLATVKNTDFLFCSCFRHFMHVAHLPATTLLNITRKRRGFVVCTLWKDEDVNYRYQSINQSIKFISDRNVHRIQVK